MNPNLQANDQSGLPCKKRFAFGNSVSEFGIDPEAFAGKLCIRFLHNILSRNGQKIWQ